MACKALCAAVAPIEAQLNDCLALFTEACVSSRLEQELDLGHLSIRPKLVVAIFPLRTYIL